MASTSPEPEKEYPVADVDDAAGFMAAARKLQETFPAYTSAASTRQDTKTESESVSDLAGDNHATAVAETTTFDDPAGFNHVTTANPEVTTPFDEWGNGADSKVEDKLAVNNADPAAAARDAISFGSPATKPPAFKAPVDTPKDHKEDRVEDREHQITFKTWGQPEERSKPASRVRRVILTGLPTAWRSPNKVLSLIHGGVVESVYVTPTGKAHILFCDHEACDAFYKKYPNGIDLESKFTAFVETGHEVDVVSSALAYNLSVGSSRVVRVVGANMDVTMEQLYNLAKTGNRKVEKILDTYVPDTPRTVVFRFCSIENAVHFHKMLVRDADWEHCNIQYGTDPCELATGYHVD
ncbi:hypothetical protein P168DRAFT_291131 [Aspergillus campestris IBT 28561]|uniref:Uncharacterized protein n=1 Tax=Aspergillus campestris (strain IBT 28561) TaxID=1392248 RepID=A0A2I1CZC3_ASPC2|nr:uncharacterized protein P168DRAFT_291131 [Aspergillus campestris IBT 28561]PKY02956.1 hypothetical protein P168DRAFT_291131 [Aspergillus campestris IBT 28561]